MSDDQDQQVQEANGPTVGGEREEAVQSGRGQDQGDLNCASRQPAYKDSACDGAQIW